MASKYYEPDWLFDSGKLFNLAVASRGSGKTFAFTRKLLQFAVKTKRKFVLLVRYANEIETYKMSGFGAINAWISDKGDLYGIQKTDKLSIMGNDILLNHYDENGERTGGEQVGFIISLNTYQKLKKIDYSDTDWIFMDEMLTDDGKYLKDEPTKLLNLIETISRGYKEAYRFVRFFGASNATSLNNPYFAFFKLYKLLDPDASSQRFKTESFAFDMAVVGNKDKETSQFGRLIANTSYGDYSRENKWLLKEDFDIIDRNSDSPADKANYYYEIPSDAEGIKSKWLGLYLFTTSREEMNLPDLITVYFREVKQCYNAEKLITAEVFLKRLKFNRYLFKDEYTKLLATEAKLYRAPGPGSLMYGFRK